MPYVLQNIENKKFVEVVGDGSEGLVELVAKAKIFVNQTDAEEALQEHDKWVGPLEIKIIGLKVLP
jgi:hypothetical protein